MRTARLPQDCQLVDDWLEKNRDDAFRGGRENKTWMEWWCLLEAFNRYAELADHAPLVEVEHTQQEEGLPDFYVFENDMRIAEEVTEATVPEDRRAIRAVRQLEGARLLGEPLMIGGTEVPGGRFRGGTTGDAWEQAYVDDTAKAINRKSAKSYAEGARLVIYPNSNATFADGGAAFRRLEPKISAHPFSRIDVLWVNSGLVVIDRNGPRLFEERK